MRKRVKRTSFRVYGQVPVDEIALRLQDVSFISGRYIVGVRGAWGEIQFWAESVPEGLRMCLLMLEVAGWPASVVREGVGWTADAGDRAAPSVTMRPARDRLGRMWLSARSGPEGAPTWAED